MFDPRKAKGLTHSFDQMQEEYRRLEVLAFEMETTIGSLEAQLASANEEKEVAISNSKSLASKLQELSDEFNMSHSELHKLQEEISDLRLNLEESKSCNHKMEDSIKLMVEEKDELAMQLTEALLAMEEEKVIWAAKEKASIEAIDVKSRTYTSEITHLSKEITDLRDQLASCREDCKVLRERLSCSEENSQRDKELSKEKSLENEKLINDLRAAEDQSKQSQVELVSKLQMVSSDHCHVCEQVEKLKMELNVLSQVKECMLDEIRESNQILRNQLLMVTNGRDVLKSQTKEQSLHQMTTELSNLSEKLQKANAEIECLTSRLSELEAKMHVNEVVNGKEKTKLRMRLRGTQAKMEAYSLRYKEAVQENNVMDTKYKEASTELKIQLTKYAQENFHLKKQLAALKNQCIS